MPSPFYQQLVAVLERYMSSGKAHGVVGHAIRNSSLDADRLSAYDFHVLSSTIDRGIEAFVGLDRRTALLTEIAAIAGVSSPSTREVVVIKSEQDISYARTLAREMCERHGLRSFEAQKAATEVSSLARRLLIQGSGAAIEIALGADGHMNIAVREDEGAPSSSSLNEPSSARHRASSLLYRELVDSAPRASVGARGSNDGRRDAWERFWVNLDREAGGAFWDVEPERGALRDLPHLKEVFSPRLPVVDLGCGDGRQTRALTTHCPRVFGVDIAEMALAQAKLRYRGRGVIYQPLDALEQRQSVALHGRIGDACVYTRLLLVHLSTAERAECARSIEALLGAKGVLYLIEPAQGLDSLLGAPVGEGSAIPPAAQSALRHGLRIEGVGRDEVAAIFPAERFEVIDLRSTVIETTCPAPGGGFAQWPAVAWSLRRRVDERPRTMRPPRSPSSSQRSEDRRKS